MGVKKAFVLRVDESMLKAIEHWASDEFRSTNGQIEWILNKALKESGRLLNKNTGTQKEETNDSSEKK